MFFDAVFFNIVWQELLEHDTMGPQTSEMPAVDEAFDRQAILDVESHATRRCVDSELIARL
jgi:hypothetical protein